MNVSLAQLRAARAMLAWTSDELARHARVHRHTVRKLECGKAGPQRGTLLRIIAALEAGGVEFVGGGVQPKNSKTEFCGHYARARARSDTVGVAAPKDEERR